MELTLDQALQKGIEAHKAGKVQEADRYYTAILKANPKHPDANHNMGVLAAGVGKVQEALPFFKTALEANPSIAQYWISYIDALIKLDRIDDAKAVFDQAKNAGAKGDGFDNIESSLATVAKVKGNQTDEEILDKAQELLEIGKYDVAIDLLLHQIKQSSKDPNVTALLSHCYILNDNLEQAKIYLDAAKDINPNIASVGWNETRVLLKQLKVNEALAVADKTNKLFPDDVEGMGILGSCLRATGNFEESLKYLNKAIQLNPNYAEALINRGLIYLNKKDKATALTDLEKAHILKPHIKQIWHLVLNLKMEAKDFENTISLAEEMVKLDPVDEKIFATIARCYQHLKNYDQAVVFYNKALSLKPDYAVVHNDLGMAFQKQGKLAEAIKAYTMALAIKPELVETHNNMGNALKDQDRLEEAIEAFNKALAIKPDYVAVYNNMGIVLKDHGRLEEATEAFNKALAIKPDYAEAYRNLSSIKKYREDDNQIIQVQELYKREDLSEDARCSLSFALAKMYEDIGELDQTFTHLFKGNTLRRKLLNYSITQDKEFFTNLKETQPNLQKNSLEIGGDSIEYTPIFILGMTRSGTTLVEQIISSHSEVTGAGELNYVRQFGFKLVNGSSPISTLAVSEFRKRYISAISKISNGKQFITDKMPQNFRFIPLICAAFPEAKIIHTKRNGAATCWSNYKQYFSSTGLGYCYDLKDVVTYYELYTDLIKRWKLRYDDRIYHLNYESITTDQETQTRKLIKHLGLTWEDACLSPHKNKRSVRTASQQQVRQKVYQGSSEAWRKYETFLNGAFDSLPS